MIFDLDIWLKLEYKLEDFKMVGKDEAVCIFKNVTNVCDKKIVVFLSSTLLIFLKLMFECSTWNSNVNRALVLNGYIRRPWFIQSHDGSSENPYFMSQFLFSVNRKRRRVFQNWIVIYGSINEFRIFVTVQ